MTSTILKILNGNQAGVEVSLPEGEYGLGNGVDDDIQLIDVALKPGHVRLRISGGTIEVAGGTGSLKTEHGLLLAAAGSWQEVEPLDILVAGTTRFALGLATANWASLAGDNKEAGAAAKQERPQTVAVWRRAVSSQARLPIAVATLVVMSAAGGWWFSAGASQEPARTFVASASEFERLQKAVRQLPFAQAVAVKREVDGSLYVTGYVSGTRERRAVQSEVERTGVPARLRIWVFDVIRSEVQSLIEAEGQAVTFDLSRAGELVLSGLILDELAAESLVGLIRDRVLGIAVVTSHIRTAKSLFAGVKELAKQSQIESLVLLRLDGSLIEASGILPNEKIDAWVGFLQAYASRFSGDIALRSLVQLQDVTQPQPAAGGEAIVIGAGQSGQNETVLDVERLRHGSYDLKELFVGGLEQQPSPRPVAAAAETAAKTVGPAPARPKDTPPHTDGPRRVGDKLSWLPEPEPEPPALNKMAEDVMRDWRDGAGQKDAAIAQAMEKLVERQPGITLSPLLNPDRRQASSAALPCWPGSSLNGENLLGTLFWLDLLSVTDALSLKSFDPDQQLLVLQAAFNPSGLSTCLQRLAAEQAAVVKSLYLDEIRANPDFVRFITRDLATSALDVAGASVSDARFLQTRQGQKMSEGAAPDGASRIAFIGELGAAIESQTGISVAPFGTALNWLVQ